MAGNTKRKDSKGRVLKKGESQRNNGTYMYRWTDRHGSRQCIYAGTLNELREIEEEINKELTAGICRKSYTLNDQIKRYLDTKCSLADSTMSNYRYYFNHMIEGSQIGKTKITDIKKSDILIFYNSLSKKGVSVGTIKILHKIIRPALELACDDNAIMKNPADGCTKDFSESIEKKYALTFEEENEFLERIRMRPRMKRYYPMYAILLKTGLRISEAVGLTWDDISMQEREISINHQVQCRTINGTLKLYASTTKTNSGIRVIPMTDEVYNLFVEQRKIWFMTKREPGFNVDGYSNFVFVSHVTGKCMNHNNIRRMMRNVVSMNNERTVQLPHISPHILRHTACCRLAESGCDIKVLQYIMGQTDIRTTMQVYNHVDMERVKREMDRLKTLDNHYGSLHQNLHQLTADLW